MNPSARINVKCPRKSYIVFLYNITQPAVSIKQKNVVFHSTERNVFFLKSLRLEKTAPFC